MTLVRRPIAIRSLARAVREAGADDHLERYARAVRLLRSADYGTVAVVTDHGFFHWDPAEDEVLLPRQALHAFRLRFQHPRSGKIIEAEAPLPAEFERTLAALRQHRRP